MSLARTQPYQPFATRRAFRVALGLHFGVIALFTSGYFFQFFRKEPAPPPVFTLVPPAQPRPEPQPPDSVPEEPPVALREPEVAPPRPLDELPEAPPMPEPPPPPKPPRPEPVPEAPPQRVVSAEDFFREHGIPRSAQVAPRSRNREVNIPPIRTSEVRENLQRLLEETPQISTADRNAFRDYLARVYASLRAAWSEPPQADHRLSAEVRFRVSAQGRYSGLQFVRPSGDAAFDESIREAFSRAAPAGPTPSGEPYTLTLTFELAR